MFNLTICNQDTLQSGTAFASPKGVFIREVLQYYKGVTGNFAKNELKQASQMKVRKCW
jgi:hypothetical protein